MSIVFEPATPVARKTPGRVAEPNPYAEAVAGIALQVDDEGQPKALAFVLEHSADPEQAKKDVEKVRRQIADAARKGEPKSTAYSTPSEVKDSKGNVLLNQTRITFWTVAPITHKPKNKDEATAE